MIIFFHGCLVIAREVSSPRIENLEAKLVVNFIHGCDIIFACSDMQQIGSLSKSRRREFFIVDALMFMARVWRRLLVAARGTNTPNVAKRNHKISSWKSMRCRMAWVGRGLQKDLIRW